MWITPRLNNHPLAEKYDELYFSTKGLTREEILRIGLRTSLVLLGMNNLNPQLVILAIEMKYYMCLSNFSFAYYEKEEVERTDSAKFQKK